MAIVYGANYGKPTLDLNFAKNKSLIDTVTGRNLVTFSRAQANYLTTYVGADGLIKYAGADEPRFDHNPLTGECLGLLVEESRANLISDPTLAYSYVGVSITAETSIPNPVGTYSNIRKMQCTASTDGHGTTAAGYVSYSSGNAVHSIFVKKGNHRYVALESRSNLGGGYSVLYFDFDTETITNGNRGGGASFVKYPNGWYRIFSINFHDGNNPTYGFRMLGSMTYETWTATGNEFVYFWGPQLEAGSFPTSYIPTTGSTVTRSADNASITGTNFSRWYNQSEGTWFVDFANDATKHLSSFDGVLSLDTNTPKIIGSSITGFGGSTNISPVSARQKVGLAYGTTEGRSFNGTISSGSGGTVSSRTQVRIGTGAVTAPDYELSTTINRLTYYPTRLQDFQLQQLTR